MQQYRSLFGNRNFLLLWIGTAISNIGDFFNSIALVKVLSADPAHLGLWMSLIMIVKVVPGVLLGPVAGVVADRIPRRTILVTADLLRAVLVGGLVFADSPSVIILLVALAATVSTFSGPAYSALLPTLVKPEELVAANSLSVITGRMAMLIGNGLGALVMIFVGAHNVFLIDSASYLVSAGFRLALVLPAAAAIVKTAAQHTSLIARFTTDLKEAFVFIGKTPTIRHLMTAIAIAAIPDSALSVLMTTFFTVEMGLPAEGLGVVWALMGGTAVVGALAIGALGNKVHWKYLLSVGATYIWACSMGALLIRGVISSSVFVALIGLGSGAINVGIQAAIGLLVPNEVRGRVFGAWNTLNNLIYVVGVLIAGWLSDRVGPAITLMGFVTFYLVVGIQTWFAFRHEGTAQQTPAAAAAGD
ncbi:MAG: multidrug efflux protein [Symbiobacteriaceae bacterium]|nr:multidrug efflux protein [Symbiobacteriaceae bacterium]